MSQPFFMIIYGQLFVVIPDAVRQKTGKKKATENSVAQDIHFLSKHQMLECRYGQILVNTL